METEESEGRPSAPEPDEEEIQGMTVRELLEYIEGQGVEPPKRKRRAVYEELALRIWEERRAESKTRTLEELSPPPGAKNEEAPKAKESEKPDAKGKGTGEEPLPTPSPSKRGTGSQTPGTLPSVPMTTRRRARMAEMERQREREVQQQASSPAASPGPSHPSSPKAGPSVTPIPFSEITASPDYAAVAAAATGAFAPPSGTLPAPHRLPPSPHAAAAFTTPSTVVPAFGTPGASRSHAPELPPPRGRVSFLIVLDDLFRALVAVALLTLLLEIAASSLNNKLMSPVNAVRRWMNPEGGSTQGS